MLSVTKVFESPLHQEAAYSLLLLTIFSLPPLVLLRLGAREMKCWAHSPLPSDAQGLGRDSQPGLGHPMSLLTSIPLSGLWLHVW